MCVYCHCLGTVWASEL